LRLSSQMSMKNRFQIWLCAVIMLCLFGGILTNDILCSFAHAIDVSGQKHDHPYGHDHHHGNNIPLSENDHKDKGHDHNHDANNEYCNTFTFHSSLQRVSSHTFKFDPEAISATVLQSFTVNIFSVNTLYRKLRYCIALPPKIPDIRIFIRSFQI